MLSFLEGDEKAALAALDPWLSQPHRFRTGSWCSLIEPISVSAKPAAGQHTDNLERRIAEHRSGSIPGYTSKRLPVIFLWSQDFQTRDYAFAAERKLKGWSRAKKEAMMAGNWVLVSELARSADATRVSVLPLEASTGSA